MLCPECGYNVDSGVHMKTKPEPQASHCSPAFSQDPGEQGKIRGPAARVGTSWSSPSPGTGARQLCILEVEIKVVILTGPASRSLIHSLTHLLHNSHKLKHSLGTCNLDEADTKEMWPRYVRAMEQGWGYSKQASGHIGRTASETRDRNTA